MQIVILSWPFKYGVADWRLPLSCGIADSLYCQTGMLEHARRRFLAHSSSVLNTDIDELVITEGGSSIFELVENSTTGLLVLSGVWVENHPIRRRRASSRPRHRDFACVSTGDQVGCETKWAVVPARVPNAAQWHVHRILGMSPSESRQARGVAALQGDQHGLDGRSEPIPRSANLDRSNRSSVSTPGRRSAGGARASLSRGVEVEAQPTRLPRPPGPPMAGGFGLAVLHPSGDGRRPSRRCRRHHL